MGKNKSISIPIKTAKEIAVEKNYDIIIIIGINQDDLSGHITTYGKTKLQCKIAGHIGQEILSPEVFGEDGKVMKTDWQAVFNNGKEYKKFEETEKESETKNKTCRRCGDELVVGVKENANGIQVLVEECVNDNCPNSSDIPSKRTCNECGSSELFLNTHSGKFICTKCHNSQ